MNLTKTSLFVRKFLKYIFVIVGSYYLITLIIFPGAVGIIKALFVKKEPANPIYGQLDQLEFFQKQIDGSDIEVILDTPDGKIPQNFPDKMKVYKFKPQQYSYLAGKNAITEAEILGFTEKDLTSDLKGTIYRWRNSITSSTLTIDINSRELELTTSLNNKSSNFTPGTINEESAKRTAVKTLSSIYRFNDELYPKGTQKVALGNYVGNRIQETTDPTEAQIALVDFYRSIENYPIFGPDPSKGLLRVVVRRQSEKPDPMNNPLVQAKYWELSTQSDATYTIIPVTEAWSMIQQGKGIVTSVKPKNSNSFETYTPVSVEKIFIDNVFLAYYENEKYQTYLQPIYVFSGTYTSRGSSGGDIVLYYPAVSGQYTKQTNQPVD